MVSAKKLCYVAVLTALTVVLSSFSIPTPVGAHVYLTDAAIIFAGLVLDPLSAFIVGGVGAFIGDAIFYPAAMFVSLFTHGAQAVAVSLIAGGVRKFADDGEKDDFKKQNRACVLENRACGRSGVRDYGGRIRVRQRVYLRRYVCRSALGRGDRKNSVRIAAIGRRGSACADFSL